MVRGKEYMAGPKTMQPTRATRSTMARWSCQDSVETLAARFVTRVDTTTHRARQVTTVSCGEKVCDRVDD